MPSLRYVNLQPFGLVNLFSTDGVDNLVYGRFVFQAVPFKKDPSSVVGLLCDNIGSCVEDILGDWVTESSLSGMGATMTGRLSYWAAWQLGGADIQRLSMTMDPAIYYPVQTMPRSISTTSRRLSYLQTHDIVLIYFNEM
ncbi:hypothetical protein PILCRDRAFT_666102 [Piloderma croceum F 1598]|uniref:Uncharacterized protein n=1 Tax=Piloderma croceum (strain F 1598) TaxID=765440 RepID=A0A0C3F6Y7_PILCF|nr:hypothetical protein PILCRDRAFT_666102 [Piloderma croceum F 1598]